ncbi:hypothetical protein A5878_000701, partial [Enterococcus sp. 3G6_DIV0642]
TKRTVLLLHELSLPMKQQVTKLLENGKLKMMIRPLMR